MTPQQNVRLHLSSRNLAEYFARSVPSLYTVSGGHLVVSPFDVQGSGSFIAYEAMAMMTLAASGIVVGRWAGISSWFVVGDATA